MLADFVPGIVSAISRTILTRVPSRRGAEIESLGDPAAQIVVERAMYTSPGGVTWNAGTNALAARIQ